MTPRDAHEIYQAVFDRVSSAIMASDKQSLLDCIALPHVRRTLHSETIIETETDLNRGIMSLVRNVQDLGVNTYIRLTKSAEYLTPDYIQGHHVTHALRGATPLIPSYENRAVLRRYGDIWKIIEIDSALSNPAWHYGLTDVSRGQPGMSRRAQTGPDARRLSIPARVVFQEFLDALSQATNDDDFDAYHDLFSMPLGYHVDRNDFILTSPDALEPFFEMLKTAIRERDGDGCERQAGSAEYLSADLICGYHEAFVVKGKKRMHGPVKGRMLLRNKDGRWRVTSITNTVDLTLYPPVDHRVTSTLVTELEIQERTKKWPTSQ